jgi:adenine deaminase
MREHYAFAGPKETASSFHALREFIEGMPKIELHLHIEGSLEPELAFKLAERNRVTLRKRTGAPYQDAAELREAYQFGNLQEFLDLYYQGMEVLRNEDDFYELTYAYLKKVASQNVVHAKIFFDPQGHTERGVSFDTVIGGIVGALRDGERDFAMTAALNMSFLRHLSEEHAFQTLEEAMPYMEHIEGFGLDSSEKGHPPSKFRRLYQKLHTILDAKTGKPKEKKAHICEEGPPEYAEEALELGIDCGDHGNRILEKPSLVKQFAERKIGLTVCPLSNLKLCNVKDNNMKNHPLKKMLDLGLKATVNSDDPAYFGGYMNENFVAVAEALNLTRQDIVTLARNAIEVSFLSPEHKAKNSNYLDKYVAGWESRSLD